VLDLLLPQRCVVCRACGEQLCARCRDALPRIVPPLCERCGAPTAWPVRRCAECSGRRLAFAAARAVVGYDERVRALVRAWKERGLRRLARIAVELAVDTVERPRAEAVSFVPPDRDRLLKRGHSTAEALARGLGERWELPVVPVLRWARPAPPQRTLGLSARRSNLAGAFAAKGNVPRRLVLVDDVYTTGSTVHAAASELRRAGAREVRVVTFARTIRVG
jgi:ComF family protein